MFYGVQFIPKLADVLNHILDLLQWSMNLFTAVSHLTEYHFYTVYLNVVKRLKIIYEPW